MASSKSDSKAQVVKDWLLDQGILALVIVGLTIGLGILLGEIQPLLGWRILIISLTFILLLFAIVIWLVQKPVRNQLTAGLDQLKLQVATETIDWLLDTEQLAAYELKSPANEIWLLTSDLLDDVGGGPFQTIVNKKVQAGTHYVYYVPNRPEIRARVEMISQSHGRNSLIDFVYLPDSFFFLVPRLDIVIYNPLSNAERSAFMGIPVPGEGGHFHAQVSADFIDKLIGVLLPEYQKQLGSAVAVQSADANSLRDSTERIQMPASQQQSDVALSVSGPKESA